MYFLLSASEKIYDNIFTPRCVVANLTVLSLCIWTVNFFSASAPSYASNPIVRFSKSVFFRISLKLESGILRILLAAHILIKVFCIASTFDHRLSSVHDPFIDFLRKYLTKNAY